MATHGNSEKRQLAEEDATTAKPGIPSLPVELMLNIASNLGAAELSSLARTCRGLNNLLSPLLYKHNVQEQNSDAVLWACEHNSIGTFERLREAGAKFDFVVEQPPRRPGELPVRFCPMHIAAKHGHADVLAWLLNNGGRLDVVSQEVCDCRSFPYHDDRIRRHRARFADPQWSVLHLAVCGGSTDAAVFLIERGASLIVSQKTGEAHDFLLNYPKPATTNVTVMHTAAAANNVALIDYLVERNLVDLKSSDSRGYTPFFYAAAGGHTGGALARIDQLLGPTVTHSRCPVQFAIGQGAFGCARYLLRAGHFSNTGRSLVSLAAETTFTQLWDTTSASAWAQQREAFITELLARGHSWYGDRWPTPLHALARQPPATTTPSLFAALLTAGCPADSRDDSGDTPLDILARELNTHTAAITPPSTSLFVFIKAKILLLLHHGASLLSPPSRPSSPRPGPASPLDALLGTDLRLPPWRQRLADEVLTEVLRDKDEFDPQCLALWPPLGECVSTGRADACRVLVKHGARFPVIGVDDVGVDVKAELVRKGLGFVEGGVAKPEVLEALACCVSETELDALVFQARILEAAREAGRVVWRAGLLRN
jgi:ankyrin repeat protein